MQATEIKPGTFECRCPAFAPHPLTVHTPDRRTLFLGLVPGQPLPPKGGNTARWGAAWKRVERAAYAMIVDNRAGRWTDPWAKEGAEIIAALGKPVQLAFGANCGERVTVTCSAEWDQEPTDAGVVRMTAAIRKLLEAELKEERPGDVGTRLVLDLTAEMINSGSVRRDGKIVTVEAASTKRWLDVLKAIPVDGMAKAEVTPVEK